MPTTRRWISAIGITGAVLGSALLASKTIFAGSVPMWPGLPPLVATRQAVVIRELPNAHAVGLTRVAKASPLYLRCHSGKPLVYGPWVGVLHAATDNVGWVEATSITPGSRQCPVLPEVATWRLRRLNVNEPVNVRIGPSPKTLAVGHVMPGRKVWTDGRFVELAGVRWIPVLLDTGVPGWARANLLKGD